MGLNVEDVEYGPVGDGVCCWGQVPTGVQMSMAVSLKIKSKILYNTSIKWVIQVL